MEFHHFGIHLFSHPEEKKPGTSALETLKSRQRRIVGWDCDHKFWQFKVWLFGSSEDKESRHQDSLNRETQIFPFQKRSRSLLVVVWR
jgi:hypothetical protein